MPLKNRIWNSIQGRLLGLLLAVLLPLLIAQMVIYYDRLQTRKAMELQANLELARSVAKTFEAFVRDVLHQEQAIGVALTLSHSWTSSEQHRLLQESKRVQPSIRDLAWVSPQGRVLVAVDRSAVGTDISDRSYFREIVSGQEWTVSELLLSRVGGDPIFTISRGVRNEEGRLLGVVLAIVVPEDLGSVLRFDRSGSGAVLIIDGEGRAVYRQPPIEWSWEKRNLLSDSQAIWEVFEGREVTGIVPHAMDGTKRMFALVPIPSIDWVAGASRPEEEALAPVLSYLRRHVGMFLFVALTSFLVALLVSRSLAGSVRKLQRHALALGRGEMNKMTTFDGPVELQDLGAGLNRMVEEIRIRETQWQAVFDATQDTILLVDEAAKCVDVNPAAVFSLGMTKEEMIGRTLSDFTEPGFDFKAAWEQFQREGRYRNTLRIIRRDGGALEMEVTGRAHVLPSKHLIVGHDITHLIRAETALRQAKEEAEKRAAELEAVWESLAEGVMFYDTNHRIVRMNPATEKILGFGLEDVKIPFTERVKLFRMRTKDGRVPDQKDLAGWRALRGEMVRNEEFIVHPKGSNSPVHILSSAAPIRTSGGEFLGAIQTLVDITALKSAQEDLRRAHDKLESRVRERTAELERANRDLQDFAFVASHDLQEPLRKTQIFAKLLKTRYSHLLDQTGREHLDRIQSYARRMSELVRDVLHYSMITSRAQPFAPTDLNELIRKILNRLKVSEEQTGLHIEVGDLPTVEADSDQMDQLFSHLIGNALKFRGEEKPRIRIYEQPMHDPSSYDARYHRIVVEDNGIGIAERYLDRIFTPFQRVHDLKYEGTGMGLAICRKIVERHGGKIMAKSEPGKGSAFIVTLPQKQLRTESVCIEGREHCTGISRDY